MTRYIFVAGGVMSGIGKGIAASSIGRILTSRGFKVTAIKIDPYINIDAGTMNPIEHGEAFVTADGLECDQDMGNYERFFADDLLSSNYMTTGRVYSEVIKKERNSVYKGKCVEVVPHIPEEVIKRIKNAGKKTKSDFVLIEIGGTVGEYQTLLFLEAVRMMKLREPRKVLFILVSYLPIPKKIGEMKTKPTQNAVRLLNEAGIQPNIILGRSEFPLDEPRKRKISIFCNVSPKDVISAPDADSIYEVPLNFEKEKLSNRILRIFEIQGRKKNMKDWETLVKKIKTFDEEIKIAVVSECFKTGDFTITDSYISLMESIKHATWHFQKKPIISWIPPEKYKKDPKKLKELKNYDGVIIPESFENAEAEGKIKTIEYCRKNKIPFFGIGFGMQLMAIEFARNVCELKNANFEKINKNLQHPLFVYINKKNKSKRLGAFSSKVKKGTLGYKVYKAENIKERHNHRFEFNNDYQEILEKRGLIFSGINPSENFVEMIEIKNHPFFMGVQFRPEFKTKFLIPHPLFKEFIRTTIKKKE